MVPREVEKSGAFLNSFIQLGPLPDGPSHPMCATCLTSVGYPISISLSFTTNIWEMYLKPLQIPFILVAIGDATSKASPNAAVVRKKTETEGETNLSLTNLRQLLSLKKKWTKVQKRCELVHSSFDHRQKASFSIVLNQCFSWKNKGPMHSLSVNAEERRAGMHRRLTQTKSTHKTKKKKDVKAMQD